MGAVSGGCVLSDPPIAAFDVDRYRTIAVPTAAIHRAAHAMIVLGSTQPDQTVDRVRAGRAGVEVRRRRGGGGAVLIVPGDTVWVDLWLPSGSAYWRPEAGPTAAQVGRWWAGALGDAGAVGVEVHGGHDTGVGGAPRPSAALARLVCFADIGAGEVLSGGHKLVGLTQWRGRQGALVQGCVYRRFHPGPLLDVLAIDPDEREAMAAQLAPAACGWTDAGIVEFTAGDLIRRLRVSGRWDVVDVE